MTDWPLQHLTDAELEAKRKRLLRELHRREKEAEREARLQSVEAGHAKIARKVDHVSRTANEAAEIASAALRGRVRLGNELEAEIKERRADRDRIQQRVTNLELREIDRNPQNRW